MNFLARLVRDTALFAVALCFAEIDPEAKRIRERRALIDQLEAAFALPAAEEPQR